VLSSEFSRDDNIELARSGLSSFGELPVASRKKGQKGGKIFLTVCNPWDLRKNFLNILEGFQLAASSIPSFSSEAEGLGEHRVLA